MFGFGVTLKNFKILRNDPETKHIFSQASLISFKFQIRQLSTEVRPIIVGIKKLVLTVFSGDKHLYNDLKAQFEIWLKPR